MSVPRWMWITALAALALTGAGLLLLIAHWPFGRERVEKAMRDAFSADVSIAKFTSVYFPHPGCVAEGVSIGGRQVAIRKLTVQAAYSRFFQRLELLQAEGLVLRLPADGGIFRKRPSKPQKRTVVEVVADGAILEIEPKEPGGDPLRFAIRRLRIGPVSPDRAASYTTVFDLPKPPGEVSANGQIGPWKPGNTAEMPVSGSYTFTHAKLGVFHGISGTLSSEGKFHGPLGRIDVDGTGDLPDFELTRAGHPVHLSSRFHVIVNGTDGDSLVQPAYVRFQRTDIAAHGDISGQAGESGKTVSLDLDVRDGRIQDLLHFFLKPPRSPMTGEVSLHARAVVPPRDERFLKKLRLQGDFGIGGARFASPKTQHGVDFLSERARGEKDDANPEDVISNLKGHVAVRDGIAQLSNLSFGVPGAVARLQGSYNLLNEAIDLRGTLTMQATVSEATKGVKSFLLKAVNPLFKKKGANAGAVLPIKITGTYSHPSYGLAFGGSRKVPSGSR